jgi:hypothetical protein
MHAKKAKKILRFLFYLPSPLASGRVRGDRNLFRNDFDDLAVSTGVNHLKSLVCHKVADNFILFKTDGELTECVLYGDVNAMFMKSNSIHSFTT